MADVQARRKQMSGRVHSRELKLTIVRQLANRGWYYAKQHVLVSPSKRVEAVALRDAIETIILDCAGYGYRRVTHVLQREGWKVNHKHVLRIMREESLLGQIKRHFVHTTDSRYHFPIYPNLVTGRTPDAPDVNLRR